MQKIKWHPGRFSLKGRSTYLFLGLAGLVIAFPALWLFLSSFKTQAELNAHPIQLLPTHIGALPYYLVLRYSGVVPVLLRTFVLGITTAFITCITSALAGYAFARIQSPWRKPLFSLVIALLVVPGVIMQIPQFVLYSRYHMINTYWPWYLAALGATNPLYIFMYRQFFLGFPKELEEAAEIDGASPPVIFLRIILPNAKPAIATILIFAFNAVWGDFLTPTLFLNNPYQVMGTWMAGAPTNDQYALVLTVIYVLPVILLFALIQKNIQKGILFTGIHG